MRSGGCLSAGAPSTCCQLALAITPPTSISPLASGSRRHVEDDIAAVHLVGPARGRRVPVMRSAVDFEVARLQRPAERQGDGELGIDLARCGRVEAAFLQELEGLAVEHLERNRQRPWPRKAIWPCGRGSFISTVKVPLRPRRGRRQRRNEASGTVISSVASSSRSSARGTRGPASCRRH